MNKMNKPKKPIKGAPEVIEGEAFIVPGGQAATRSESVEDGGTIVKSADFWTIKIQKSADFTYRASLSTRWSDWANELVNAPLGTKVRLTMVPTGETPWTSPTKNKTVVSCDLQGIEVVQMGTFPRSQKIALRWNPRAEAAVTEAEAEANDR